MGYFDALARSSFKQVEGRWLFYPWGALGRGLRDSDRESVSENPHLGETVPPDLASSRDSDGHPRWMGVGIRAAAGFRRVVFHEDPYTHQGPGSNSRANDCRRELSSTSSRPQFANVMVP